MYHRIKQYEKIELNDSKEITAKKSLTLKFSPPCTILCPRYLSDELPALITKIIIYTPLFINYEVQK